jgi:organic radical activating enzyme
MQQAYGPYPGDPYHPLPVFEHEKRYAVHSMFRTIQGEGYHAGKLAVFVRFSGCNVWSGREEDRERDAKKGSCARFCDTEFFGIDEKNGGGRFTAREIVQQCKELWGHNSGITQPLFVVFTGGEPSLQADTGLVQQFRIDCSSVYLAMETNGSKDVEKLGLDWITLSPKPPMPVVEQQYSEIKVLYPEYNPLNFSCHARLGFKFIQPVDPPKTDGFYMDELRANMRKCVEFVCANPNWCISIQQHKVLGIP